jgi:aminoglycoside 3'-phosphotransferase-2
MEEQLPFEQAVLLLPPSWRDALAGREAAQVQEGMGGAAVFQLQDPAGRCQYLKLARGPEAAPLVQEIARTEWLSQHHLRVPEFLMQVCTENVTAVLMTAVAGHQLVPGTPDVPAAAHTIGRGLARLHALPAEDCPFDETIRTRMQRARDAIDRNVIDASQFDDRNAGVSPAALYERLARTMPAHDDLVVVHGDATLANLMIGPDGELGFIDCGNAGRSDRYVDLAIIEAELRTGFGPEAARTFAAAYGMRAWDEQKAAFFRDLYEFF